MYKYNVNIKTLSKASSVCFGVDVQKCFTVMPDLKLSLSGWCWKLCVNVYKGDTCYSFVARLQDFCVHCIHRCVRLR